jgi:hypothetical protein
VRVTRPEPHDRPTRRGDRHLQREEPADATWARFLLGPRAGRAEVRDAHPLATSQKLDALARLNDGSVWSDTVDVVVVLAACIEGEGS